LAVSLPPMFVKIVVCPKSTDREPGAASILGKGRDCHLACEFKIKNLVLLSKKAD